MGYLAEHVRAVGSNNGTATGSVTVVTTFAAQPVATLLMAFVSSGRDSSITAHSAGWTLLVNQYTYPPANRHTYHVLAKEADGTETSLSVTTNTSSTTAEQHTFVAAIDAIEAGAFTGFADKVEGPVAVDNTAVTTYLDSAAMNAPVATSARIDVVGGNFAVSSAFNQPTPAATEVVVIGNQPGTANRGAFGVFALAERVAAGGTSPSRRYTAAANQPESINSFLLLVPTRGAGWQVITLD